MSIGVIRLDLIKSRKAVLKSDFLMLHCTVRKEEGVSVDPTFTVNVVFGKRDEPMLVACARQLVEHISNSGSSKALVLSLGLRDHSTGTLKGIVSAVIEKLAEVP
ncbi:hypothetical protein DH2020_036940 [Rehmannia glutinosa]|uniref:Proteasome assembly chaperone 3 n=1 Tax=Rehmannia glutinosa TaxID=99300 RepID=A0ABR0V2B6_REHGL